jgi:putative PIN family toxin of toxin-antitoxin system
LSVSQIEAAASLYLPFAERVDIDAGAASKVTCRDPADQMFVTLAEYGRADVLVTGDEDLLSMQGQMRCTIETPAAYRVRFP